MAAPVVAHQPKVLREGRDLRVPHAQRGAERIRQHEHGRALRPLDFDIDRTAVGIDHRHGLPFAGLIVMDECQRLPGRSCSEPRMRSKNGLRGALIGHGLEQLGEFARH